jgi:hypothetical protein
MNPDQLRPLRWRAAAAITVGLLGAGAALTAIAGAGGPPSPIQLAGVQEDQPGPCDEAEHADDPRCGGSTSTVDDGRSTTTASPVPDGTTQTIDAAPGGTVVVAVQGSQLVVVSATPNPGWTLGEQQPAGREVEVRFLTSAARVDVDAELEDGQIRTRVRLRALDDSSSNSTSTTIVDQGGNDDGADHDVDDDNSGPDGDDGSGHDVDDDHSGTSGSGSDSSGSDSSGHDGDSGSGRDHPEDD